jgi:hypothetical protein
LVFCSFSFLFFKKKQLQINPNLIQTKFVICRIFRLFS